VMMAQHSQRSEWTECTTTRTDGTGTEGSMDAPENAHGQFHGRYADDGGGAGESQSYTSYASQRQRCHIGDEYDDGEDGHDAEEGGGVDRFHLGSVDLGGDRRLTVSVERSVCAPESSVVRLLFGDNDDDGDTGGGEELEGEAASYRLCTDDTFSVSTTLPSQETMGYSARRRGQQMHCPSDPEVGGRADEASIGSMVTPPPPSGSAARPRATTAKEAEEGTVAPSRPSQNTSFSTQQSSATEGASQRSRRRKGPKKKQSGRVRANADVAKVMGVGRRECIPRTKHRTCPPALTPMPPAGSAARSTGKRPALTSALRNGNGSGKRPALSSAANRSRSTRFSPLPKANNGGGANNTPMCRGVGSGEPSRSPAISSASTVLVGSANNTPVPVAGGSGRSPANSGTSTATVLMSRYGSASEAETVLMSRTPTPPRRG